MKIKNTILLVFILFSFYGNAQNNETDSLWQVYKNQANPDTNRLKAINTIIKSYINKNPDTAIVLSDEQLILAKQKHQEKFQAIAISNIGSSKINKSDYPSALNSFINALKIFTKIDYKQGVGSCYNNIGNVYQYQKNYEKALKYYLNALEIRKQLNDIKGAGNCYNNIGLVYINEKNYPKALEYFQNALKLKEQTGDKLGVGTCYSNIASVYQVQNNYESSLDYYFKSLKIKEDISDKFGVGSTYANISILYNHLKKYDLATQYALSALEIGKEIKEINLEILAYDNLASISEFKKDYSAAYKYLLRSRDLNDSIFNIENSKQLSDIKTNYEVEKKEIELKSKAQAQKILTDEEKKRQQIILYSVAGILLVVIVFSLILYKRFKLTSKQKQIIELKEKETNHQNVIIKEQKHLVEEKHKEITDSINYAERIQRSFLASKKLLDENLNDYFIFFLPKDVVSGDFYWASKLNNQNFAFATADSTGHGVPGAIMSLLNITSLEKAIENNTNPADILNHTRKTIIERLKKDGSKDGGKDGMDCSLISFDYKNNQIQIASANNPVWIVRSGELIEVKGDKMPVGKHDNDQESFVLKTINVFKGDIVYALTDGYPDQFGGEKGKKFMSKNLKELLLQNAHLPMPEQKEILDKTFIDWKKNVEQVDDVTVVGIKI